MTTETKYIFCVEPEGLEADEDNLPFENYRILDQRAPRKSSHSFPTFRSLFPIPNDLWRIIKNLFL